jgi:hypothetical protein
VSAGGQRIANAFVGYLSVFGREQLFSRVFYQSVLLTFPDKKTGAERAPVFIYSAACARKRRPITSIKSQPSRNGIASSLEKSDSTTVSQPSSPR